MKHLLYEDSFGPFDVAVIGTFQLTPAGNPSKPGTVIVRWYAGPSFPGAVENLITGDLFDVIKILPGRVVEFQVYQNVRGLEISARTLFPQGTHSKTSVATFAEQKVVVDSKIQALQDASRIPEGGQLGGPPGGPIFSACASPECGQVSPCDPPNNAIDCSDPLSPFCFQAEAPTARNSSWNDKSGCCG